MPGVPIQPLNRLLEATTRASAAQRQVRVLADVALLGGPSHPDAFDAAILRHRQAQWQMVSAMAAWARWHQAQERADEEVWQRAA
ncbi:MAG TPA: hypothetical protein VGW38_10425 [Chloroflexota bacterium]|nr:hypothetical protein [Chloroflexota bacterium]